MIRIWFLGTGSAEPAPDRNNLSLLISDDFGKRLVIVDCSGSPIQAIFKTRNNPENLTDVILTHSHTDHVYGLPSLIHTLWLYKKFDNRKGINIWGEKSTLNIARQLISAFSLEDKKNAVNIRWNEIKLTIDNKFLELGNTIIHSFPVTHGNISALGIKILGKSGKNIIYSSDALADEKLSSQLTSNTVVLIQDCGAKIESSIGHAGAKDIALMIKDTNIERLYLVHFPELSLNDKESIIKIISNSFSGEIIIPDDLEVIDTEM